MLGGKKKCPQSSLTQSAHNFNKYRNNFESNPQMGFNLSILAVGDPLLKKAFFFQFSPFGVTLGLLIILPGEKGSESDKTTYLETIKIENINIKAVDKKRLTNPQKCSQSHTDFEWHLSTLRLLFQSQMFMLFRHNKKRKGAKGFAITPRGQH